jgi:hypothetical protein
MKKVLLFAAAMCFMISAQAQTETNKSAENQLKSRIKTVEQLNRGTAVYTQKLDSIIMSYQMFSIPIVFEYDNQFNTKKVVMSGFGISTIMEHSYDSQNRRISTVNTYEDGSKDKIEYTYNNQGLIEKATQYEFEEGVWVEDGLNVFEYDANGNMVLVTVFDREDNVWEKDEKTEFTYQNGKLVRELQYDWLLGEWVEDQSIEYNYDAQGDLVETIEFDLVDLAWLKDNRMEYTYDANHNCTSQAEYDFNNILGDWEIENKMTLTYDLSVPSNTIAGLDFFDDAAITMNNKPLTIEETTYDDEMASIFYTLYYSETTGMGEHNGSQIALWPNPASETLSLNAKGLQQVEIFSMDGRQVMHLESGIETIDVSALARGCYLLKATFADGSKAVRKFVKE